MFFMAGLLPEQAIRGLGGFMFGSSSSGLRAGYDLAAVSCRSHWPAANQTCYRKAIQECDSCRLLVIFGASGAASLVGSYRTISRPKNTASTGRLAACCHFFEIIILERSGSVLDNPRTYGFGGWPGSYFERYANSLSLFWYLCSLFKITRCTLLAASFFSNCSARLGSKRQPYAGNH